MPESNWYYWAIKEIRASRMKLKALDKMFLLEVEVIILKGKKLDPRLEEHLMRLLNKCTDVRRVS